ncbi:hypothetical protein ColTof4_14026 [Colletotrichum tofieldiae]|nr:hypothetical protein ColTof3_14661 [Colletotrichum tofieldiae]GKT81603.1 hypothetical protein ColTof4_14026 [Colletotrichum tofieldiae]
MRGVDGTVGTADAGLQRERSDGAWLFDRFSDPASLGGHEAGLVGLLDCEGISVFLSDGLGEDGRAGRRGRSGTGEDVKDDMLCTPG